MAVLNTTFSWQSKKRKRMEFVNNLTIKHCNRTKVKTISVKNSKILKKVMIKRLKALKGQNLLICMVYQRLAHKPELSMRLILSATNTAYNYALAKWLEEKLKPQSVILCLHDQ